MLKRFWQEEDGMGVVEILLIIAVLIIIAILFRNVIIKWVKDVLAKLFPDPDSITDMDAAASGKATTTP
ncbi:MAG: Flp1 family type IVb pilin [Lachnospiraceae bacterium]|nr:Flp1 family type IVb pilin [Lachnospiraceae bacterium]